MPADSHPRDDHPAPSYQQMQKLEKELAEIKQQLRDQQASTVEEAVGVSIEGADDLLEKLKKNLSSQNVGEQMVKNEAEVKRFIQSQKTAIKQTQEKLEKAKKQFKADKEALAQQTELQAQDPETYSKKKAALDSVKT